MDFISFLKKEFGINHAQAVKIGKKLSGPARRRFLEQSVSLDKESVYRNISQLLNQALDALPNEYDHEPRTDFDEHSARVWQKAQQSAHQAIAAKAKTAQVAFPIAKDLVPVRQNSLSPVWKFGLSAGAAVSFFIALTLAYYQPDKLAAVQDTIERSFFGFLDEKQSIPGGLAQSAATERGIEPLDPEQLAAAKAAYIQNNGDQLAGQEVVPVSQEELIGQVAGEMEQNPDFEAAMAGLDEVPLPPPPPELPADLPGFQAEKKSPIAESLEAALSGLRKKQDNFVNNLKNKLNIFLQ